MLRSVKGNGILYGSTKRGGAEFCTEYTIRHDFRSRVLLQNKAVAIVLSSAMDRPVGLCRAKAIQECVSMHLLVHHVS